VSSMSEATGIDFNELARLIAAELDSGMQSVNSSVPWNGRLHIASMRVRLGQMEELSAEKYSPNANKCLLYQRYPLAEQGWMFEVEIAAGAAPAKARISDKPPVTLPTRLQTSAAVLFSNLPVNAIKGVSSDWAEIFKQVAVNSIGDLIAMKHDALNELIRLNKNKYPLNLHTKARLLNTAVPKIPASPADHYTLYSLLTEPPKALRKLIGAQHFSASASERLSDLLALFYTLLDSRILKDFTIRNLRTIHLDKQKQI